MEFQAILRDIGPNSGRGFSLPEGNVDKGRATFVTKTGDGPNRRPFASEAFSAWQREVLPAY